MTGRPKSVGFIAGIAMLQGILAFAMADKPGVAPAWAAAGPGRYAWWAFAALSIVLGCAMMLRDDAARVVFLWLEGLVALSAVVALGQLIHEGALPSARLLARMLWCFVFGMAALWILSGPNAMAFFGAGREEHGGHGARAQH
jgi:hypothetical protein